MTPESIKYDYYFNRLKAFPIFHQVDDEIIHDILAAFKQETVQKGTAFDYSNRFYVIVSGHIKVYRINPDNGREFTMYLLAAGDIFDILTLLDGKEHHVLKETLDETDLLYMPIQEMRKWIISHNGINQTLYPYLASRMRMIEASATDITLLDTTIRLAKFLLQNADLNTHEVKLVKNLSHKEIAHFLGTTRAVLNRHLQELKHDGLIEIGRNKISVKDLHHLHQRCEEHLSNF